jgi:drug/metabolite transporter (DMT)-like permease
MNKYLLIILLSIFFQSLASIFGKKTGLLLNEMTFLSFEVICGFLVVLILLSLQGYLWIKALKNLPLSYAYPFNALTFVIIMIIAVIVFHEQLNFFNILGSAIIIFGLGVLSRVNTYE